MNVSSGRLSGSPSLGTCLTAFITVACFFSAFAANGRAEMVETGHFGGSWQLPGFEVTSLNFDPDGNAYVFDGASMRLIELDEDLQVETIVPLDDPPGMIGSARDSTIGPDGKLYTAWTDSFAAVVRVYSLDGNLLDVWGLESGGDLHNPEILVDPSGLVLLLGDTSVRTFSSSGVLQSSWGGFDDYLQSQIHMALDDTGHVLLTGGRITSRTKPYQGTRSIYRFQYDGTPVSHWTEPAEVTESCISMHGSPYCTPFGIVGFSGIAPRDDGGVWVTPGNGGNAFRGFSASGLPDQNFGEPGNNDARVLGGPDGNLWSFNWRTVVEYGADGTKVHEFTGAGVPKYGADRGEGLFDSTITQSLEVGPNDRIFINDPANGRGQRFGPDGSFELLWDGPFASPYKTPELVPTADGGVMEIDLDTIRSYDQGGAFLGSFQPDLGGETITDSTLDSPGDLRILTAEGTVFRLNLAGDVVGSWHPPKVAAESSLFGMPGGSLLIVHGNDVRAFSDTGTLRDRWSTGCADVDETDVDAFGNLYQTSWTSQGRKLAKFSPEGEKLWEETLPTDRWSGSWGALGIKSDGEIVIASFADIYRFKVEDPASPGPVIPCPKAKPATGRLRVLSTRYLRGHHLARIKVSVPAAGRLKIGGDRRMRSVSKALSKARALTVTLRLKRAVRRAAGPRRVVVKARIRFNPKADGEVIQKRTRRVKFKR